MPVLTLKVPPETAARLQRLATRRRVSKSVVMREALVEKLQQAGGHVSLHDLMGPTIGSVDSGERDRGHNQKHLEGFGRR